jgi:hypothetical protein
MDRCEPRGVAHRITAARTKKLQLIWFEQTVR